MSAETVAPVEQAAEGATDKAARRPKGALLFLPAALNRGAFLVWLKRVHAWTGFWGALAFLLMGTSGFLLNHRSQLKIETGAPQEVSSVVLPVSPGAISSEDDLARWARKELGLRIDARPVKAAREEKSADVAFMGKAVTPVKVWKRTFSAPNGNMTVEYVPGALTASATRTSQSLGGLIKDVHKGSGLSIAWVLFLDSVAGALIAMSLTGFLLWSRLHGPRLAALAILAAAATAALATTLPQFL